MPDRPPACDDPDAVRRAAGVLRGAGFDEANALRTFDEREWPLFRRRRRPLPLYRHRTRGGSPLDTLLRLFSLAEPVPVDAVRAALAPMRPEEWGALGLLRRDGDDYRATVELAAYRGLVLASDWPGNVGDEVMP